MTIRSEKNLSSLELRYSKSTLHVYVYTTTQLIIKCQLKFFSDLMNNHVHKKLHHLHQLIFTNAHHYQKSHTREGVIRRTLAIVGGEWRVHPQRLLQHHVQIFQTQNGVVAQHCRTTLLLLLLFKGRVDLLLQLPLNVRVGGLLGGNSIGKIWLEFELEISLEFWLEIPYTKKKLKTGSLDMSQNQNGISSHF